MMKLPAYVRVLPEIETCLASHAPVVALETTVVTHGLPYPDNIQLAVGMEQVVRDVGCTPATIGFLNGILHIGMKQADLVSLASAPNSHKLSKRDFAPAVVSKWNGGTTVSGTLAAATLAGIPVFATGGIGGVHRGRMDISADLPDLARSPVIVVCAGAKAILDIPATIEFLETWGVPIIGYQTDEFPAFYSITSGIRLSVTASTANVAAEMAHTHWSSGFRSSVLVVVPPPAEEAIPVERISGAIDQALREARKKHISGQAVTPFLLSKVSELTGGESKHTNLALLRNNARIAAQIGLAYTGLTI